MLLKNFIGNSFTKINLLKKDMINIKLRNYRNILDDNKLPIIVYKQFSFFIINKCFYVIVRLFTIKL